MTRTRYALLLVALLAGAILPDRGQDGGQEQGQMYENLVGSTVRLSTLEGGEESHGSGVVIGDGLILTAFHVIAGCEASIRATLPLRQDGCVVNAADRYLAADALPVVVVATDPTRDLALLRCAGLRGRPMVLAAKSPSPGDAVFTVGGDGDVAFRFAAGHVRSIGWASVPFPGYAVSACVISNSVPLNMGDSGGGLVGRDGRLVGINSFIETDKQAVNNCIDITEIKTFLAGVTR